MRVIRAPFPNSKTGPGVTLFAERRQSDGKTPDLVFRLSRGARVAIEHNTLCPQRPEHCHCGTCTGRALTGRALSPNTPSHKPAGDAIQLRDFAACEPALQQIHRWDAGRRTSAPGRRARPGSF